MQTLRTPSNNPSGFFYTTASLRQFDTQLNGQRLLDAPMRQASLLEPFNNVNPAFPREKKAICALEQAAESAPNTSLGHVRQVLEKTDQNGENLATWSALLRDMAQVAVEAYNKGRQAVWDDVINPFN